MSAALIKQPRIPARQLLEKSTILAIDIGKVLLALSILDYEPGAEMEEVTVKRKKVMLPKDGTMRVRHREVVDVSDNICIRLIECFNKLPVGEIDVIVLEQQPNMNTTNPKVGEAARMYFELKRTMGVMKPNVVIDVMSGARRCAYVAGVLLGRTIEKGEVDVRRKRKALAKKSVEAVLGCQWTPDEADCVHIGMWWCILRKGVTPKLDSAVN